MPSPEIDIAIVFSMSLIVPFFWLWNKNSGSYGDDNTADSKDSFDQELYLSGNSTRWCDIFPNSHIPLSTTNWANKQPWTFRAQRLSRGRFYNLGGWKHLVPALSHNATDFSHFAGYSTCLYFSLNSTSWSDWKDFTQGQLFKPSFLEDYFRIVT